MKLSWMTGAVAGASLVTAGAAVGGYQMYHAANTAKVISARALTHTSKLPRQDCHDETVTRTKEARDQNRVVGTGIGALVGGLLGHEVGGGTGKAIATVVGAGAGGYAGNKLEQKVQQGDTYTTTEQRCTTVYDIKEEPAGYEVVYEYKGAQHHVHMEENPGDSLPVKDGKVVVASTAKARAGESAPQ